MSGFKILFSGFLLSIACCGVSASELIDSVAIDEGQSPAFQEEIVDFDESYVDEDFAEYFCDEDFNNDESNDLEETSEMLSDDEDGDVYEIFCVRKNSKDLDPEDIERIKSGFSRVQEWMEYFEAEMEAQKSAITKLVQGVTQYFGYVHPMMAPWMTPPRPTFSSRCPLFW
jgi:hypothetical protein